MRASQANTVRVQGVGMMGGRSVFKGLMRRDGSPGRNAGEGCEVCEHRRGCMQYPEGRGRVVGGAGGESWRKQGVL